MSLYVRVFSNFYSHRKTARLRAILGNDALWIPPRLWAYAAENQPNGNFRGYTGEELAILLGYTGDAKAMLEALLAVGFLDSKPLRIHDWKEYNGYHNAYSSRASKAAQARWGKSAPPAPPKKKGKDSTGKDSTRQETSIANSNASSIEFSYSPEARVALTYLNEKSGKSFRETSTNLGFITARLKESGVTIDGVRKMIDRQCARWLKTEQADYLRPETLFNATKFENYYASKDDPVYHENHPATNRQGADRNAGTANAKRIGQYDGIGRVLPVQTHNPLQGPDAT